MAYRHFALYKEHIWLFMSLHNLHIHSIPYLPTLGRPWPATGWVHLLHALFVHHDESFRYQVSARDTVGHRTNRDQIKVADLMRTGKIQYYTYHDLSSIYMLSSTWNNGEPWWTMVKRSNEVVPGEESERRSPSCQGAMKTEMTRMWFWCTKPL